MKTAINHLRFITVIGCSLLFATQIFLWVNINMIWLTLVVSFILIPLLDYFFGDNYQQNFENFKYVCEWIPRVFFCVHFYLLFFFISIAEQFSSSEICLIGICLGTITGATGITIAHELMHKKLFIDRLFSKLIMCSVLYGHFCVEHIRGHHVRVATPNDPATAKRGQNLYSFIIQSTFGSFKHACKLESLRLNGKNKVIFSLSNNVISSLLLSLILLISTYFFYNSNALFLFIIQALWAIVLLEATNYIEHYGLLRKKEGKRYEPVQLHHSWNSNFYLSNWILFHLPWHSDHHKNMDKSFAQLRPVHSAPQLPFVYPLMIVISFFPFIFIPIMEKTILKYKQNK